MKKKGIGIAVIACATTVAGLSFGALRWRSVDFEDVPAPAAKTIATGLRRSGEDVAKLSCGSVPGISPSVKIAYGCSSGGTLCYANIGHNGELVSSGCGDCGGKNQPSCEPWNE